MSTADIVIILIIIIILALIIGRWIKKRKAGHTGCSDCATKGCPGCGGHNTKK